MKPKCVRVRVRCLTKLKTEFVDKNSRGKQSLLRQRQTPRSMEQQKEGPKQVTNEASLSQVPKSHVPQASPGKGAAGVPKAGRVQSLRSMFQPCVVQHPS